MDNDNNIEYLSVWPPQSSSDSSKQELIAKQILQTDESLKQSKITNRLKVLRRFYKDTENENEGNIIITTAETLLASWWRNQLRNTKRTRLSTEVISLEDSICQITCPRAKINAIKRHPSAKAFLHDEVKQLQMYSNASPRNQYTLSTILFNLAILEDIENDKHEQTKLSLLKDARFQLHKCISMILPSNYENLEKLSNTDYLNQILDLNEFQKEVLAFSIKLDMQINAETAFKTFNSHSHIPKNKCIDNEIHFDEESITTERLTLNLPSQHQIKVDRVHSKDLSVDHFILEYCKKRKPLVITGLSETEIVSHPWTLDHISKIAGSQRVSLKKPSKESIKWAKLEPSIDMSVAEFISNVNSGTSGMNYLFDWSLPLFCPQLNSEITIPKYFQNDYLKKTAPDALYRKSWPSLFISAKGSLSELHVDAFGSNFWMYLFRGRKRWTFFSPDFTNALGPKYYDSLDPIFDLNLSNQNIYKKVKDYACEIILEPGELLFVPFGSPHRVENLEDSVAISGNFVDQSNIQCVVGHLRKNALQDPRAGDLLREFIELKLI